MNIAIALMIISLPVALVIFFLCYALYHAGKKIRVLEEENYYLRSKGKR